MLEREKPKGIMYIDLKTGKKRVELYSLDTNGPQVKINEQHIRECLHRFKKVGDMGWEHEDRQVWVKDTRCGPFEFYGYDDNIRGEINLGNLFRAVRFLSAGIK